MKHFILTTIAAVILVGCSSYKNSDKVELLSEKKSPNGKFIATSFSHVQEEVLPDTSILMRIYVEWKKSSINMIAFWGSTRHGWPSMILELGGWTTAI